MNEALADAWLINNRINLTLIDEISQDGLEATLSTRGGRTNGHQLSHLLAVRRWKLEAILPELLKGVPEVGREDGHDPDRLRAGFEASGEAIAELFRRLPADGSPIKGFRAGTVGLLGYLIAHEAHHRGHIMLTLKQAGVARSAWMKGNIWNWNTQ